MKKVTKRASAVILVALLVLGGMGVYLFRLLRDGGDWAGFQSGSGLITDRDGVHLLDGRGDGYEYADSALIRAATIHAVGDTDGKIGTGARSAFRSELADYSFVTGTADEGGTVRLSLDADICAAAYEAMDGRKGAVLVYNYKTGEILCMVSTPGFDPVVGFDENDSAYEGAYINRCLSSSLVPGSIFKIVTLAAAIENIPNLYERSFYCGGSVDIGGVTITCAGTHYTQTIEQAFANSCNCAFAELSAELGGDTLTEYAEAYGLTESHDLDGIPVKAGSIESAGHDSVSAAWQGIGQYMDLVCPYGMLRLMGAIANEGLCVEPTLLAGNSNGSERLLSGDTARQLRDMMNYNVVYDYGGESAFPGLQLCAKTGTAEVGDGTDHAWFAGFIENPGHPYAFVVLVENAGGGLRNAGPVANTVLQAAIKD